METVIVLKNLAYASDGAAGVVEKLVDTTDELADGAVGIYNEKGDLLDNSNASAQLATPVNAAFSAGAGTLPADTYHYRVSALDANGETLASTSTSQVLGAEGGVNVNWDVTTGAVGYKIYGRTSGAHQLIATVGAVTTFLDDGSITPDGALPTVNTTGGLLADYSDCKEFVIAWNKGGVIRQSKGIVRKGIARLEQGAYVAPVMHKVVVGGTTEPLAITFEADAKGHVGLRVADNTFSGMFATAFFNASVYKKASMDEEAVVDALVTKLNANLQLPVTAVKIESGAFYGITIESKTRGQILSLSTDGLLEDAFRGVDGTAPSILPVIGSGVGIDVAKHEEEASVYLGNGNYRELTTSFYSSPMTADKAGEYKTIVFQEHLGSPYLQETNVRPEFTLYIPNGENSNLTTTILLVFGKLIAGAYTSGTNVEPGTDGL